MSPCAVNFVAVCGNSEIVAQKISFGFKRLVVKCVVGKSLTAIGGTGQSDGGCLVVSAAVIEDQVDRAAYRINRHPLEELVFAIMDRIIVHSHRNAPALAAVAGRGGKYIQVAIGEI